MDSKRVLHITIIFTDGKKREFNLDASTTKVSDLIGLVHQDQTIIEPPNTTTIILYHGRICSPDDVLGDLESMDEFTVHCFFKVIKLAESQKGDNLDLRGFDRLQRLNYSPEQIARVRANFRAINGIDDQNEQDQIEIEDEWFPAIFSSELPLDSIFDDIDDFPIIDAPVQRSRIAFIWNRNWLFFVTGFLLGYFLGIGAFIFAFLTCRNKKAIFGIFLGSCVHYIRSIVTH
ncbi:hypothetical protein TRFO_32092 [Tritrichomonas foetus]|uniref:Ubiquitin-like domain-containing protein n=1 Tax=Tritrichomonas foetus TaxID=1144522 RepID=A0A1J4JPW3_9EUKA|nr:hypothetical protein TRFO_32092 [Tritrichomonas foetus]|eukprot:OHT01199.1 hypothetical protein TRFO_32092 [Tritrichomonas foetus]